METKEIHLQIASHLVRGHEGFSSGPYKDTVGKTTIGYGRNLDDVGLTKSEAEALLYNDLGHARDDCIAIFKNFEQLSELRKGVLIDMAFNLGRSKLLEFKKMIDAVENEDFMKAGKEMLDSKWAKQVKTRADRLSSLFVSNSIENIK